jgi:hypothetical protein
VDPQLADDALRIPRSKGVRVERTLSAPYANRRLFWPLWLPFLSYFQAFRGTDIAVAIERNIEGQAAVAYIEVLRDVHLQSLEELS